MDNSSTQKSGHLRYSAPLPYKRKAYVQKSGTALLLFRFTGSGIAIVSEQATLKPTPICTHTRAPIARAIIKDTYPEDIKMLQCVGYL